MCRVAKSSCPPSWPKRWCILSPTVHSKSPKNLKLSTVHHFGNCNFVIMFALKIIIIISLTYLLNLSMYIEFTILNHIIPNTNLWCPVCKFLAMSSWHTDCESLPRYHPDRVFLNYLPPPGSSRLKPGMIFSLNFPGSRTSDVIWTQVNYSNVFNRRFKQLWSSDWTINLNVQPSTMNPILLAHPTFIWNLLDLLDRGPEGSMWRELVVVRWCRLHLRPSPRPLQSPVHGNSLIRPRVPTHPPTTYPLNHLAHSHPATQLPGAP